MGDKCFMRVHVVGSTIVNRSYIWVIEGREMTMDEAKEHCQFVLGDKDGLEYVRDLFRNKEEQIVKEF